MSKKPSWGTKSCFCVFPVDGAVTSKCVLSKKFGVHVAGNEMDFKQITVSSWRGEMENLSLKNLENHTH